MGSISDEWRGPAESLVERLRPRDDLLVRERADDELDDGPDPPSGSRSFAADAGPFTTYERRVDWRPDGTGVVVEQRVEWRLGFPYWGWIYAPFVRRALRDGITLGARPWWLFPDRLSVRQARATATMALFSLVAGLLYGQLTQVLTFASADIGDGSSGQQAAIFALVRIGAVLTAVMMFQADRFGRRRIALWSFGIAIALSAATALVPGLAALTVLQAVSRNLAVAGLLAVDTICVEELPAGSRAMAAGLGAMAYGLGTGVVVVALPLADISDWGWRLVFALSLITVPLVVSGSRTLKESGRFQLLGRRPDRDDGRGAHEPALVEPALIEPTPFESTPVEPIPVESTRIRGSRFVLLAALFLLLNLFIAPFSQLQNDYLRADRGFDGLTITIFTVLTGTPAGLGVLVGGRIADTRGRRWALVPGLVALGVFTAIFFAVSGAPMWISALAAAVLGTLTVAPLGVLAPELFPTARRGGARGALNVLAVTGSVIGLLLAGIGVDANGYGPTFALLALGPLVAAGLALAVPETRGRELEDLNRAD
ncbi:MFS transporter [Dermatobacter hominis]|uniref:MFS transporter n=1 Tax=Dermatobacter hominis TaxID=2884263 RepID=UPI001D123C4E|nr:MFS transporter [Dermatobacter hominis]UDY37161.1 MFS transporter [Dermatobacter hominis]